MAECDKSLLEDEIGTYPVHALCQELPPKYPTRTNSPRTYLRGICHMDLFTVEDEGGRGREIIRPNFAKVCRYLLSAMFFG